QPPDCLNRPARLAFAVVRGGQFIDIFTELRHRGSSAFQLLRPEKALEAGDSLTVLPPLFPVTIDGGLPFISVFVGVHGFPSFPHRRTGCRYLHTCFASKSRIGSPHPH